MNLAPITRKSLLSAFLDSRTVTAVEVREITFEAGQLGGRHRHPCPVVGYIVSGTAVLEVQGQSVQILPAGSAFYEPADATILRFDNASASEPLRFIAYYLLHGDQPLIEMV